MKRFICLSLCALMLFSSTADAKKKYWKRARHCAPPCVPCAPAPCDPKDYPCQCALIDVGLFWIGEKHTGTDCRSPEPIYLTGSGYTYGICQTSGCTGGNCLHTSTFNAEEEDPVPIIKAPIHPESVPLLDSKYHECLKVPARFIKIKLTKNGVEKEIKAKLFTIQIDAQKIVDDYKSGTLPSGPDQNVEVNTRRGSMQRIIVGFETSEPPDKLMDEHVPTHQNVREVIVNDGPDKAIVFLAP
tara:strand:+ start:1697 stop:2425 length:729 start_codon:yes stop_codon:yes gene_type:complete